MGAGQHGEGCCVTLPDLVEMSIEDTAEQSSTVAPGATPGKTGPTGKNRLRHLDQNQIGGEGAIVGVVELGDLVGFIDGGDQQEQAGAEAGRKRDGEVGPS